MSNLNNEERLKILRARLDEIQQKNFTTENVQNEKEKVVEFTNCVELWGDTPKQFPLFSEILEEKINFLKKIY